MDGRNAAAATVGLVNGKNLFLWDLINSLSSFYKSSWAKLKIDGSVENKTAPACLDTECSLSQSGEGFTSNRVI